MRNQEVHYGPAYSELPLYVVTVELQSLTGRKEIVFRDPFILGNISEFLKVKYKFIVYVKYKYLEFCLSNTSKVKEWFKYSTNSPLLLSSMSNTYVYFLFFSHQCFSWPLCLSKNMKVCFLIISN